MNLIAAHVSSRDHRTQIESSDICGCFYRLATFHRSEIAAWIDGKSTALRPKCGIDAVLGSATGFPMTVPFLGLMRAHWFQIDVFRQGSL